METILLVLSAAAGALTVWLHLRQRPQRERTGMGDVQRGLHWPAFLAVFLPLVALLALLQLYMERPRGLYLALAGVAVLGLLVGLARAMEGRRPRGRGRGPR